MELYETLIVINLLLTFFSLAYAGAAYARAGRQQVTPDMVEQHVVNTLKRQTDDNDDANDYIG